MKKRLTALLLALIMLACAASCSGKKVDRRGEEAVTATELDSAAVLWSDTTTVTASMYTYFFNAYYRSFVNKYDDFLDTMNLDTTKPLKQQKFNDERTWYEYLMTLCYNEITETMAFADAAKTSGMELSDDDLEIVESALNEYDIAAEKADMSADAYIASLFGKKVNRATFEKCLRLQRMAAVYYTSVSDGEAISDEDCQKYFAENPNEFLYYDYMRIIVPEADAEALKACTDGSQFKAAMRDIIAKNNFNGDYGKYKDSIDKLVANKLYKRTPYAENSDVSKWAFDATRKPYDIFTKAAEDRESDVDVYMILPAAGSGRYNDVLYRDAEPVRNICYILRSSAEDAQRIYDDWKDSGDHDEESFKALAEKYNGGTANNIDRSDYQEDLSAWIFSPDVKTGDSTVIDVEGTGTYILYMLDAGDASWLVSVRSSISEKNLDDIVKDLLDKFPAQYSALIYNTDEITISR